MNIGYIRVSSADQNPERQEAMLNPLCDKIFLDKTTGKNCNRPALKECLNYIREGDTLYVASVDRLARNLQDLLNMVQTLLKQNISIKFLKENMEFSKECSPVQTLYLQIIGAMAEFERELIKERQKEGIAIAKQKGKYHGRGMKYVEEKVKLAVEEAMLCKNISKIAKKYKVSRTTMYSWVRKYGGDITIK